MALQWIVLAAALLEVVSAVGGNAVANAPFAGSQCTKPRLRTEWRHMSKADQRRYIKAVKCMQYKPPISKQYFPIVHSRYDDFVALHANATGGGIHMNGFHGAADFKDRSLVATMSRWGIHNVGVFLPWHRYVLTLWEDALINECGWSGGMPYWDWYLDTPDGGGKWEESPLFAPDAFGGNGKKMNHTLYDNSPRKEIVPKRSDFRGVSRGLSDVVAADLGFDVTPGPGMVRHGTGGGCVLSGPFMEEELYIGPFGRMAENSTEPPRCLTRNFDSGLAEAAASYASIAAVLAAENFGEFRDGVERPKIQYLKNPKTGNYTLKGRGGDLHTIGHSGVGGEMSDLFNSVNDPLFFLHHANIDRLWWLWQTMDLENRLKDIKGGDRVPRVDREHPSHAGNKDMAGMNMNMNMTGMSGMNMTKAGHTHAPHTHRLEGAAAVPMRGPIDLDSMVWMGFAGRDVPISALMHIQGAGNDGEAFLCYQYETGLETYGIKNNVFPDLPGLPKDVDVAWEKRLHALKTGHKGTKGTKGTKGNKGQKAPKGPKGIKGIKDVNGTAIAIPTNVVNSTSTPTGAPRRPKGVKGIKGVKGTRRPGGPSASVAPKWTQGPVTPGQPAITHYPYQSYPLPTPRASPQAYPPYNPRAPWAQQPQVQPPRYQTLPVPYYPANPSNRPQHLPAQPVPIPIETPDLPDTPDLVDIADDAATNPDETAFLGEEVPSGDDVSTLEEDDSSNSESSSSSPDEEIIVLEEPIPIEESIPADAETAVEEEIPVGFSEEALGSVSSDSDDANADDDRVVARRWFQSLY